MKIGIVVFNDVEELDIMGPWEVFQTAGQMDSHFNCEFISAHEKTVTASKGLVFQAHRLLNDEVTYDVLLIPGGIGVWPLLGDTDFLNRVTLLAQHATWITSVCTGALILAQANLLTNKRCTTWHGCIDDLIATNKTGRVESHIRFVCDGNTVTAAGVSAGIDMALWLIGQIKTPLFAKKVQHYIEYYPEPPYADVTINQEELDHVIA